MTDVMVTVELGGDEYSYLLSEANARNISVSELAAILIEEHLRSNDG